MKLLCLILILANFFLFFWEYRNGALQPEKPQTAATAKPGAATILLVSEFDTVKSISPGQDNNPDASKR